MTTTKYPHETVNEYGTEVTAFWCGACHREFTVCPSVPEYKFDRWTNCLADECPSYDITRDASIWIETALEYGLVVREPIGGTS